MLRVPGGSTIGSGAITGNDVRISERAKSVLEAGTGVGASIGTGSSSALATESLQAIGIARKIAPSKRQTRRARTALKAFFRQGLALGRKNRMFLQFDQIDCQSRYVKFNRAHRRDRIVTSARQDFSALPKFRLCENQASSQDDRKNRISSRVAAVCANSHTRESDRNPIRNCGLPGEFWLFYTGWAKFRTRIIR